ncbi:site-specific integrase [Nitratireductor aquibiodomus]|uniref:tyrosine-type recombinase/integrase n=1 Tax=Nitratireductor aquibiodomus TaxID=204799 RepID=UPI0019D3D294|nr:site-specific integrase [Nitratireductor aquibiodomus]MBN7763654.1 site-specific integrase [Nitratireductor aquibiodomus]
MPLKLYKRGDVYWISGTVCGKTIRKSTQLRDKFRADLFRIREENRLADEFIYGAKAVKTFSDAVESYLATGASTRFLELIRKRLGHLKLHDIKQNDLDACAAILYPTAQPETRNRQCYTPFIAVWNHAVKNDWANMRMWQRPRKPKGTNVRRIKTGRSGTAPVDYDTAARFVAAMSPAPAMVMTALFYTGMRPIELFSLTVADVNVGGKWIVLQSTKTGEPRGVPMHDFLVPLFAALCAGVDSDRPVFLTHKGEPYPLFDGVGGQIKGAINGARKRTGIRNVSPYTGRHTVSTQLVVNGVHPHVKDQILGHAVDSMSRHYTNVPQAPMLEAINTLPVPDTWRSLWWWDDPVKRRAEFVKWGEMRRREI